MEIGWNPETIVTGSGLVAMVGLWLRRQLVQWSVDKPQIAGHEAMAEQFKLLQQQITAQAEEIRVLKEEQRALTKEQQRQDTVIHRQQTKVTRMEVLLRQFLGLVQQHGTPVPEYMRQEITDLLAEDPPPP